MSCDRIQVDLAGIELHLFAKRAAYSPEFATLFLADTHLGKEATFRKNGIPVPRGCTQGTLQTITDLLQLTGASQLVLLGDMFHARCSLSPDVREALDEFFSIHAQTRFMLVRGNHDTHLGQLPGHWPLEVVSPGARLGPLTLTHEPGPVPEGSLLRLCGHIHPAIRLTEAGSGGSKLPCFWLNKGCLVFPALGEFTGTQAIRPAKGDRTWVIAGDAICS